MAQAREAPHHLHAGVQVGGVDQEAAVEIAEGHVAHQLVDELEQRVGPVERGSEQSPQRHVRARHLEHVAATDPERPGLHAIGADAGGPGRAHQRADARPDHQAGHQPAFLERAEHADVGQPFEAAAAEHEGEGSFRLHSLAPVGVGS